jgi:hypothetical protein
MMYVTLYIRILIEPLGETVETLNVFVLVAVALVVISAIIIKLVRRRVIRFSENYMMKTEEQDANLDQYFEACMNDYQSQGNKLTGQLRGSFRFLSDQLSAQIVNINHTLITHRLLLEHELAVSNIREKRRKQAKKVNSIIKMKI